MDTVNTDTMSADTMHTNTNTNTSWGAALPGLTHVVGIARAGIHLGIGLAAMAVDMAQGVAEEAIRRGAVIEKDGVDRAMTIERDAVGNMKDYLRRGREATHKDDDPAIEAKIEQALATFDVPTRDDIRELHMHIAAVSDKINNLQQN